MIENKLGLLQQNLEKKRELIDKMLKASEEQTALWESSEMQAEELDASIEELDVYTQELVLLNEEADELYRELSSKDFVSDEKYSAQIGQIKELLSMLTDKTGLLQKKEQFNRRKMEMFFQEERNSIGAGRRTSKAALDYYKSMNRSNVVPPQFMDRKK